MRATLPFSLLDHPDSLAQCEPCLRILTACSLVRATAYDDIGSAGDDTLYPAVAVPLLDLDGRSSSVAIGVLLWSADENRQGTSRVTQKRISGRLWAIAGLSVRSQSCRWRQQVQVTNVFRGGGRSRGHVDDGQHANDDANSRHRSYDTPGLFPIGHDQLVPRRFYALAVSGCVKPSASDAPTVPDVRGADDARQYARARRARARGVYSDQSVTARSTTPSSRLASHWLRSAYTSCLVLWKWPSGRPVSRAHAAITPAILLTTSCGAQALRAIGGFLN